MPSSSGTSNSLAAFAAANDAAAATRKKLAKQKALADYLAGLDDADLPLAVRYAAGRPFPATEERVLGVSGAAVSAVLLAMFELPPETWRQLTITHGEVGEAMAALWQEHVDPRDPDRFDTPALALRDLQDTWDALARTGQQETKRDLLRDLFVRIRTPREAAYVGKIIFGDLRTGVREGVLHAAIAEAFHRDEAAVRRAVLLVGDVGEVALLAKNDRLAEAEFRLFHPLGFMLATPVETAADAVECVVPAAECSDPAPPTAESPPPTSPWLAEHKLDGIRAQIHKQGDSSSARIAIYTRTMDRSEESFPEVVAHMRTLPGDWLLDGELVPYDDKTGQVLAFAVIQKRLGRKRPSEKIQRQHPCRFVAFDLLYRDGEIYLDRPLTQRREALEELLAASNEVLKLAQTPVSSAKEIEAAFAEARAARNEGLILKDPQSPYAVGRRGRAWLKLKTHLPTLDVVVTAAEHGQGKRRNHLSDYTFGVWDRDPAEEGARIVNIGKAFSGVTDQEIEQLTNLFLSIQTSTDGRVYQVRPQVVFEVAFDAIQESDRHAGGFALRFPRIKRIRWDRSPESADRLDRVREIHAHEHNFNRVERPNAPADAEASRQMTLFE